MQAILAKECRAYIRTLMKAMPVPFRGIKHGEEEFPNGWMLFKSSLEGKLYLYITFVFHSHDECFTVDLSWTTKDKLPENASQLTIFPEDSPVNGTHSIRLPFMWDRKYGGILMWHLAADHNPVDTFRALGHARLWGIDELLPKVPQTVESCFEKIRDPGWSYFQSAAANHGTELANFP